jgi:hypothetical protein
MIDFFYLLLEFSDGGLIVLSFSIESSIFEIDFLSHLRYFSDVSLLSDLKTCFDWNGAF